MRRQTVECKRWRVTKTHKHQLQEAQICGSYIHPVSETRGGNSFVEEDSQLVQCWPLLCLCFRPGTNRRSATSLDRKSTNMMQILRNGLVRMKRNNTMCPNIKSYAAGPIQKCLIVAINIFPF